MDNRELPSDTSNDPPPRPHSLTSLFAEQWPRLARFVRERCGAVIRRKESASDIAQSVCREALEHWSRFRGEPAELRQWLFHIAKRKIIDRQRYWSYDKREVERETSITAAMDSPSLHPSPSEDVIGDEQANQLADALMEVPEHDRDIILLARYEHVPLVEIGKHLGCTEATARKQLWRALARLEHHLRDKGG
jgi:RNA polymerase sigma-70 factor (ECF subfamily)